MDTDELLRMHGSLRLKGSWLPFTSLMRWGDPDEHGFRAVPFGAMAEDERDFGGYRIPSKLRVGWYFGSDRFASEGEFFRCTLEEAAYH